MYRCTTRTRGGRTAGAVRFTAYQKSVGDIEAFSLAFRLARNRQYAVIYSGEPYQPPS